MRISGPVPSKDMQFLLSVDKKIAPIFMKDAHSAESNETSISLFYFLSYGRLYLQFAKNLLTKKKLFKTGKMRVDCSENDF